MVGRSLDAHNECNAPALMEETPKALRVAVVEDDPRIQQLISAEITDEGHACICFGSAEDFLDEAGSDRFDLLLLDLMLPGMDGFACLKQLQLQAASQDRMQPPTKSTAFKSVSSHREEQLTVPIARIWQRTGRDRKDGFQPKGPAIGGDKR